MLKVISLGGSLIIPNEINYIFLKQFRKMIINYIKKGNKVIIVCGGGSICRKYYRAAKLVTNIKQSELDWVGVMATRLNAELIRIIFGSFAEKNVKYSPNKKYDFKKILIIGGDKPGGSSDLDTVELAKKYNTKEVINLSDISYVYDQNPKKYKNAKPLKSLRWQEYKKVIGRKWVSGAHVPFDPIASNRAMQYGLKVIIANGKDLNNLKKILYSSRSFKGTVIE
ncbi:UMP kinase [Candidatus Woesearchaeota archaeon]|nr:UMP kinase [Candidatus Woesearchaeota archaeon]